MVSLRWLSPMSQESRRRFQGENSMVMPDSECVGVSKEIPGTEEKDSVADGSARGIPHSEASQCHQ